MARPTYKRAERVADQIRMEVGDILTRKSKDPRLALVTVTNVEVTNDLRVARVYVTTFRDGPEAQEVYEGLESANGFIRMELGRRLGLRYTPEIIFRPDLSEARSGRILQILDELQRQEEPPGNPGLS